MNYRNKSQLRQLRGNNGNTQSPSRNQMSQATVRKVVLAKHGGFDIGEEAGLSELETLKCYAGLEVALQGECSACQREFMSC